MHPYITHLLADIAAERTEILEEIFPQTIEEQLEEIGRGLEGEDPQHTFSYYCGLEAANFPPPEQLSLDDMKMVCEVFRKMMVSWNLDIHFPENLPVPMAYRITVDMLNSEADIPNSGTMNFDFCTGYALDCVFKEYCPCLEFWDDIENDDMEATNLSDDELPF